MEGVRGKNVASNQVVSSPCVLLLYNEKARWPFNRHVARESRLLYSARVGLVRTMLLFVYSLGDESIGHGLAADKHGTYRAPRRWTRLAHHCTHKENSNTTHTPNYRYSSNCHMPLPNPKYQLLFTIVPITKQTLTASAAHTHTLG